MSPVPFLPDSPLWFVLKLLAFLFFFIWLRGTLPRFRYDQLMDFGWKVWCRWPRLNLLVTAAVVVALLVTADGRRHLLRRRGALALVSARRGGRPAQPHLQRVRPHRHPVLAVRHLRDPGLVVHRHPAGGRLRGRDHGAVPLRAHAAERQAGGALRRGEPALQARPALGLGALLAAQVGRPLARRAPSSPPASTPRRARWRASSSRRSTSTCSRPPRSSSWPRWWARWPWPGRTHDAADLVQHALLLSLALFAIGVVGVFLRRNIITIFMCVELMLNAVNLVVHRLQPLAGHAGRAGAGLLRATVAAAEAAVGLAIMISMQRHRDTLDVDAFNLLKWWMRYHFRRLKASTSRVSLWRCMARMIARPTAASAAATSMTKKTSTWPSSVPRDG